MGNLTKNFGTDTDPNMVSPDTGEQWFNPRLLTMLQSTRNIAGIPMWINSGCRTLPYHLSLYNYTWLEGTSISDYIDVPDSDHLYGWGVDVAARNSRTRHLILDAGRNAGFHRIGIYPTFVHLGACPHLPPNVTWIGR